MNALIDQTVPVGRLAAEHPWSVDIFDRFGLDYCCHGDRSLADACTHAGVSLADVMDSLGAPAPAAVVEPGRRWNEASITELADHIETTHHVFVREACARLSALVPRVVAAHGDRHPGLQDLQPVVAELSHDMLDHMVREERVLFPWLRRLDRQSEIHTGPPWSVKRPISCMRHDHDGVGASLARIAELTGNYTVPSGVCGSYRVMIELLHELERDTHAHIHKENNILFPAGVRAEEACLRRRGA